MLVSSKQMKHLQNIRWEFIWFRCRNTYDHYWKDMFGIRKGMFTTKGIYLTALQRKNVSIQMFAFCRKVQPGILEIRRKTKQLNGWAPVFRTREPRASPQPLASSKIQARKVLQQGQPCILSRCRQPYIYLYKVGRIFCYDSSGFWSNQVSRCLSNATCITAISY